MALKQLGAAVRLCEQLLKQRNLPVAIELSTVALEHATKLKVFHNIAYRLYAIRGLAWYGCHDGALALQDLQAAVAHAPLPKKAALRCLTHVQQRLAKQQAPSKPAAELPASEDENASTGTILCTKRIAGIEVSSTAKRARTFA